MTDLDWMHDIILESIGVSLGENRVAEILNGLPNGLRLSIQEWGLSDTEVRENVYDYITYNEKDWIVK